jgi:hypothetical protein
MLGMLSPTLTIFAKLELASCFRNLKGCLIQLAKNQKRELLRAMEGFLSYCRYPTTGSVIDRLGAFRCRKLGIVGSRSLVADVVFGISEQRELNNRLANSEP